MEPRAVRYEMMNGLLKWALAPAIGVLALALPAGAQQSASGAQRLAPFGETELEVWRPRPLPSDYSLMMACLRRRARITRRRALPR